MLWFDTVDHDLDVKQLWYNCKKLADQSLGNQFNTKDRGLILKQVECNSYVIDWLVVE